MAKPNGTDIVFRWQVPSDPDGDRIADYHFELFEPFGHAVAVVDKLLQVDLEDRRPRQGAIHAAKPGPVDARPAVLLASAGQGRKRRMGPLEQDLDFHPRGPAYPLEVALSYDPNRGTGTLRWKPNPVGRRPVKYRVYGSDEKGFSASDAAYKVNVGVCKELPSVFPANFIAETAATELAVIGHQVDLPDATKTYYRVVAVDQEGKRSGPSDYATAPRPIIYSKPVVAAKIGNGYRYQVLTNRCLGDFRNNGRTEASFWDIEKPKFVLERGPTWLKLDAATGVLSGTPEASGNVEVAVTATIDHEVRKLDEGTLKWGQEKVASIATERVGSATQSFVIVVTP